MAKDKPPNYTPPKVVAIPPPTPKTTFIVDEDQLRRLIRKELEQIMRERRTHV